MMRHQLSSLATQAKQSPESAGIYLMINEEGQVIYVGKAKNLRHRLLSYFQRQSSDIKTAKLVDRIRSFKVTLVQTELEALLLERSLIRAHDPPFNILLRDDKSFPYVKADMSNPWPRLTIVRRRGPDHGDIYIGPYSNQKLLFSALEWVHQIFPLVRCSPYEFTHTKRPCNYHAMNLCLAPCHMKVDSESYKNMVREAIKLLRGGDHGLQDQLTQKMATASEQEDYQKAAEYRDQIEALRQLSEQDQSTTKHVKEADVIGYHHVDQRICFYILCVRDHMVSDAREFVLSPPHQHKQYCLEQFMMQFYVTHLPPQKILIPFDIKRPETVSKALAIRRDDQGQTYEIIAPQISLVHRVEEKRLMNTAHQNAQFALSNHQKIHETTQSTLRGIAHELGLEISLHRCECIDISHLSGSATVASKVSFVGGMPDKSGYRMYHIASQSEFHNDDYAAIEEVIRRRLSSQTDHLPDVIVIDGGLGQLHSALKASQDFKYRPYFLAIAKIRRTSTHRPSEFDRIFSEHHPHPILLHKGSPAHRLFAHMRDEAHRFAIKSHRKTLQKIRHSSQIEQVKGIGKITRIHLLQAFSSLDHMQNASITQLSNIKGMNYTKARALKSHLKSLRS